MEPSGPPGRLTLQSVLLQALINEGVLTLEGVRSGIGAMIV